MDSQTESIPTDGSRRTRGCICGCLPYKARLTVPSLYLEDYDWGNGGESDIYGVIYNVQHNHQDYDLVDPRLTDQIVQRAARESGELSLDILTTPARFDLDEVEVGPLLGSGGFSNVYEITGLRPKENSTRYNEDAMEARNNLAAKSRDCAKSKMHPYALKHLRRKLVAQPKKYANGAIDLAIEATFLTCFDHPNILNIHGVVSEGSEAFRKGRHDSFFLIVDRLEETLQDRIITWRKQHKRLSGMWSRIVRNKRRKNDRLLVKRLKVAFDIASALCYLHSKRLIYRDTKPTNIGFGLDGTVKLFDFGLCRELPESGDQSANALFEMSGGIGTYRYMSPEVYNKERYNQKADVYSFGLVLYEILSMNQPTVPRNSKIVQSEELQVCECWPLGVTELLLKTLSRDMDARPSMAEVCAALRLEIRTLLIGNRADFDILDLDTISTTMTQEDDKSSKESLNLHALYKEAMLSSVGFSPSTVVASLTIKKRIPKELSIVPAFSDSLSSDRCDFEERVQVDGAEIENLCVTEETRSKLS